MKKIYKKGVNLAVLSLKVLLWTLIIIQPRAWQNIVNGFSFVISIFLCVLSVCHLWCWEFLVQSCLVCVKKWLIFYLRKKGSHLSLTCFWVRNTPFAPWNRALCHNMPFWSKKMTGHTIFDENKRLVKLWEPKCFKWNLNNTVRKWSNSESVADLGYCNIIGSNWISNIWILLWKFSS